MSKEKEVKAISRNYLIIRLERASFGYIWRFLRRGEMTSNEDNFIESSLNENYDHNYNENDCKDNSNCPLMEWAMYRSLEERWVIVVSVILRKLLVHLSVPLQFIGQLVVFYLNLLALNGNLLGLLCNFVRGKVVIPQRGSATFVSTTGYLDRRMTLYNNIRDKPSNGIELGSRSLMDLCIMGSKLSYENENVIKEIVDNHWKMHFVGFYDCWNDYQKQRSTQVFIICNKPVDANLILISFRGTQPFVADDWCTNFDYSWYEIPNLGRVHVGFLEALGLGNRTETVSFHHHLKVKDIENPSFDCKIPSPDMAKLTAYDTVKTKLKQLLAEHRNAKFVVTGHSQGGALAILLPIILDVHEEREMMERLMAVYTFGQPRVVDCELAKFMEAKLNKPEPRYFRVVYCNDVVPRLPYDNDIFLYKHFGVCLYYDGFYTEQRLDEEPNRNYFGVKYFIPEHANAMWELIRAFTMGYKYGEDFKETWCSISLRVVGLVLPGLSAHSPRDYINSVRLGRERAVPM